MWKFICDTKKLDQVDWLQVKSEHNLCTTNLYKLTW
jgi:hypothetical protein